MSVGSIILPQNAPSDSPGFLVMLLVLLVTRLCGSIFHSTVRSVEESLPSCFWSYFLRFVAESTYATQQVPKCESTLSIRRGVKPQYPKRHQHVSTLRFVAGSFLLLHTSQLGFLISWFAVGSVHDTRSPVEMLRFFDSSQPCSNALFSLNFQFSFTHSTTRTNLFLLL